ncbi:hypothetical protein SVAN01_06749 [Stagonosporopsis vannaccii]|nr:hypothetical protein SVAN01_06749 [Stagonosporopsis vannaccii]
MARFTSSSSRCFSSSLGYNGYTIALYACICIFLAVYLGILIALCIIRRTTGPGKHLIGLPYMFALAFMFIDQATAFLSNTLRACRVTRDMTTFYNFLIASSVFYVINAFMLAFVVIYTLNTMLRKQLGHNPSGLRMVFGSILFVLGGLLLSYLAIQSYFLWNFGRMDYGYNNITIDVMSPSYISLAFDGTFLVSILSSGALSIAAARALKKKHGTSNSLTVWISVLILALVGYSIISIIQVSTSVAGDFYLTTGASIFLAYFGAFLRAVAFIVIIIIAKDSAWMSTIGGPQQQHVYSYQQEAPVYGGMGQHA